MRAALSVYAAMIIFEIEGVRWLFPSLFLSVLRWGPEQDHWFVQLQGAPSTLQSMKGPQPFCVFGIWG